MPNTKSVILLYISPIFSERVKPFRRTKITVDETLKTKKFELFFFSIKYKKNFTRFKF